MSALTTVKKALSDTHVIVASGVVYLIVLALVIQMIVGSAALLMGITDSVFEPFTLSLALILLAWTACIVGSLSSARDVKKGGTVVAKRLGAVEASVRSGREDEKTLITAVADAAIAYGCALPSVHVLRKEDSINSMVVGSLSGDTALLFTNGALNNLNEEELLALAAHEFAHIENKNVTLNMKLMVAFGGQLALQQYGKLLVQNKHDSALFAPLKLFGFGLIGLGFVGAVFACFLRALYTRRTEMTADSKAVAMISRSSALCSVLSKIKHSPECATALHAPYVDEVRHLCFHAGNRSFWRTRFNSSHPSIDARLREIDPQLAAAYASSRSELSGADAGKPAVVAVAVSTQSTMVSKAASEAARALGIMSDVSQPVPVSDKLAMSVQDPVSGLAALFALFMPDDKDAHPRYLSAVAFSYNQNFADSVEHLNAVMQREIRFERLSVAKHATSQLKSKLAPDASRRVLLNLERLLKAQGLHNLMNYSAVQYLRHELAAEFPVLKITAQQSQRDAEGRQLKSTDQMGEKYSRLISLVLDSTDLDRATIDDEYDRVMASYPNADYPRCDKDEIADVPETEAAFQLLLMQPHAIRETFVQHCKDIFDLDKKDVEPKRSNLELLCAALGCSSVQTERWDGDVYGRKIA